MKRTNSRRHRELVQFCRDNRRLFPFAGLMLLGVALGVTTYLTAADRVTADWDSLLHVSAVTGGFRSSMNALWGACFSTVTLLTVLYLLGLWVCGAPFILLIPLFHGLGLGLTEAHYYALGSHGVAAVATVIMPVGLFTGAVLVMACAESLRLSTGLSRQLLPASAAADKDAGMWRSFRLYTLRFLLFLAAALGVGLIEVLLRTAFGGLLPSP